MKNPVNPKQAACATPLNRQLFHPKHWLSWIGLLLLLPLSWLPIKLRHSLGKQLGNYIYNNNDKRRHIISRNLQACFPDKNTNEIETLSKQTLQWYGKAMLDYCLIFFAPEKYLRKLTRIENRQLLEKTINNKPVIIFLAHSTCLEFAPVALGLQYSSFGSYKSLGNPVFDWMLRRARCRFVDFVVTRDEGFRKLVKSIQAGRVLIFLPDEDLGAEHSVHALFFAEQKATLTSAARLAKLGKADCFVTYCYFDDASQQYVTHIQPALESYPANISEQDARSLNESLEQAISIAPDQYLWTMRLFKTRPENKPPIY